VVNNGVPPPQMHHRSLVPPRARGREPPIRLRRPSNAS
jgi:hypothetical protein